MESFESKQNTNSAPEQEPFDVEKGLKHEKTILGRFRGKAKDIGSVLLLVSALSAGIAEEGFAERKRTSSIPPLQQLKIETNNETHAYSLGEILNQKVLLAYKHLDGVQNNKDAERFLKEHFDDFISASVKIEKEKKYTERDLHFILQSAEEMKKLLIFKVYRLLKDEKFARYRRDLISLDPERYEERVQQINDMITKFKLSDKTHAQKGMPKHID